MRPTTTLRRSRNAICALAFLACTLGCSTGPTLRVAASGDYPPFSLATTYGAIVGFDTDVAAQFARDAGRGMYFVPLRWPRLSEDADAGVFDVAMSGITMRSDRVPHMLFSRPYVATGAVVAVQRERAAELATLEQIDRPGVRIAVNLGGHLERVARDRFRHAEVLTVDDNRTLADRVLRGEVDAAVSEQLEVASWPVETFAVIGPFTHDLKAYAVPLDRLDLLRELNEWLAARESDGWLNEERRRWLSSSAVWTSDEACYEAVAAAIDMRMLLMPEVAAAKREQNLPIEDPVQEEKVLGQVAEWAKNDAVDPDVAVALFETLITAAKDRQSSIDARQARPAEADLDSLRRAISFYSRSLVEELRRCRSSLSRSDAQPSLEAALRRSEAFQNDRSPVVPQLAAMLAHPYRALAVREADTAESESGTYVDFCIPPHLRFDREGYSAEEIVDGVPLSGALRYELRSGRTRVRVRPGRHEYRLYVNGSTGDPRRGSEFVPPPRVDIDVPESFVVTVHFEPKFSASGRFELRWQDVYGAAAAGLESYRGLSRFDIETTVSRPVSSPSPGLCPW